MPARASTYSFHHLSDERVKFICDGLGQCSFYLEASYQQSLQDDRNTKERLEEVWIFSAQ